MEQHTCLNCQNIFNGSFCNNCGQKVTHRYSVAHVLHELVHVFTHADKGIFSFAWNIIRKPGTIALDLVEGRRKRHFNLFQYLLIVIGFVTFILVKSHFVENTLNTINELSETKITGRMAEVQQRITLTTQKYNNILQMALIPLFAFFSWRFLGKKRGYNYAENIVLHTAASAMSNTLSLFTTSLFLFIDLKSNLGIMLTVSLLTIIVTFALSYKQFFNLSVPKALLFGFLVFTLVYIIQSLFLAVGTIIFVMVGL